MINNKKVQKYSNLSIKITILGALLLQMGLMYISIDKKSHQNTVTNSVLSSVSNADKKIILFQGYQGMNSAYASSHRSEIDALPFDGITFMPDTNLALNTFSNTPHSFNEYKTAMAGMNSTNFAHTNHNFVLVFVGTPGNSANWSIASSNMANLAEAANYYNLDGIFFDVEQYDTANAWTAADSCPSQSDATCKNNMYNAGKQMMQSMVTKWPNVKILATHGISVGDPKSEAYLASAYSPCPHRDWSNAAENQYRSYFEIGLLEGTVGNNATYIDGGEDYDVHSDTAAQRFYDWRKNAEGQQSNFVPGSLRPNWTNKIGVSFGTQDDIWCQSSGLQGNATAADWKKDLVSTLKYTDEYVWAFARNHRWYNDSDGQFPHVTQDFIDATTEARNIIGLDAVSPTPTTTNPPTGTTPPKTTAPVKPTTSLGTPSTTSPGGSNQPKQAETNPTTPSKTQPTSTADPVQTTPKTSKTAAASKQTTNETDKPSNLGKITLIAGGSLTLLGTSMGIFTVILRKVMH